MEAYPRKANGNFGDFDRTGSIVKRVIGVRCGGINKYFFARCSFFFEAISFLYIILSKSCIVCLYCFSIVLNCNKKKTEMKIRNLRKLTTVKVIGTLTIMSNYE